MISADLLRGYTDSIILRRLLDRDGYGYQISREVLRISGGKVELKEATLYTAFRRLEAAGYIRSYWGDEATGARRRYYALTPEGRDKLAQDLAAWKESRRALDALLEETKEPESPWGSSGAEIPVIRVEE